MKNLKNKRNNQLGGWPVADSWDKSVFDEDPAKVKDFARLLNYYSKLYDNGYAPISAVHLNGYNEIITAWAEGKYAMTLAVSSQLGTLIQEYPETISDLGMAVMPTETGDKNAVTSTNGGESYTRVDSVYFTGINDGTTAMLLEKTAEDVAAHYAPGFCQVWPMISGDYVYFYGIEGGRFGGVQLARVKAADIENFDKYEYYTGKDDSGAPIFLQGDKGLKAVSAEDNAATYVMKGPAGEMCVTYNKYLNKFITVYQKNNITVFRTAENPWGDWSDPIELLSKQTYHHVYGGFMHERYTEQDGKVVYFMASYWADYESVLMKLELY